MAGKVFHLNRPLVAKKVRNWEEFYQNFAFYVKDCGMVEKKRGQRE